MIDPLTFASDGLVPTDGSIVWNIASVGKFFDGTSSISGGGGGGRTDDNNKRKRERLYHSPFSSIHVNIQDEEYHTTFTRLIIPNKPVLKVEITKKQTPIIKVLLERT